MQKKNLHSKIIFCIAICEFCISNFKYLKLHYAQVHVLFFKALLPFGSSYAYNIQILPEIIVFSVQKLGYIHVGGKKLINKKKLKKFLPGPISSLFWKNRSQSSIRFCFFTLLYRSLKQMQYRVNKLSTATFMFGCFSK